MRIRSDSTQADSDMLSVLLENLPQVHGQRFEDEAKMLLVEKVPVKSQAVVLVVSVRLVQSSQQFKLFQTCNNLMIFHLSC
jgi:hypothetical protein